jgi:hypothetical protein
LQSLLRNPFVIENVKKGNRPALDLSLARIVALPTAPITNINWHSPNAKFPSNLVIEDFLTGPAPTTTIRLNVNSIIHARKFYKLNFIE